MKEPNLNVTNTLEQEIMKDIRSTLENDAAAIVDELTSNFKQRLISSASETINKIMNSVSLDAVSDVASMTTEVRIVFKRGLYGSVL